jgi:hypothetical protein
MSVVDTPEKRLAKAGTVGGGRIGGRTSVGHGAGRAPPQLVRLPNPARSTRRRVSITPHLAPRCIREYEGFLFVRKREPCMTRVTPSRMPGSLWKL